MLSNYDVGEGPWESLGKKEIKPVKPKENQPWVLVGRTDAEAEAPILWPPDAKSQLLEKILVLGKIGHEFEIVKDREDYSAAVHGVAKSWT